MYLTQFKGSKYVPFNRYLVHNDVSYLSILICE